ncbi:MAG: fructosamine kinase family protein, partial [Gammaproteobacteria bacterium]|nr:fructosamine kinase family protein [Gammaproteobacteria bacterium]
HGDLWSGNVLFSSDGPVLIDPAAHYGWAEADLAMTKLFGGFSPEFYRAYYAFNPLPPGFGDRVDLYNLYHLLNHLNLFGSVYHGRVMQVVAHFS